MIDDFSFVYSMAAAFGSGALFSIVSGMGTPNPVANAITTGVAFAVFQGGFFMVRTWKCLLLMEVTSLFIEFLHWIWYLVDVVSYMLPSYHYSSCLAFVFLYFSQKKNLLDKLSPKPSQLMWLWSTIIRCSDHCQSVDVLDRSKVFTATKWRYILFSWKKHVAKFRPSELWEEFQEGSPDWSNFAPPYWQV